MFTITAALISFFAVMVTAWVAVRNQMRTLHWKHVEWALNAAFEAESDEKRDAAQRALVSLRASKHATGESRALIDEAASL